MGGTPVNFFFRSHTKINFMTKVGTSQLYDWHILSKEGTVHTKKCFTLSLTHNDLSEIPYRIAIIPLFWVKKGLLGHGSTRGISSNTVCRALNLFNLLYLINWKHFSWKKLIFEEVALILMNFGLKCPPEIKNFHFWVPPPQKSTFFKKNAFNLLDTISWKDLGPCKLYLKICPWYCHALIRLFYPKYRYFSIYKPP